MRNGKGSTPRRVDTQTYANNFDRIFGSRAADAPPDTRAWGWGSDTQAEEWFGPFKTREEALTAAAAFLARAEWHDNDQDQDVALCRCDFMHGPDWIPAVDDVLILMHEKIEDYCGYADIFGVDDYPASLLGDEQKAELVELLKGWADKHLSRDCRVGPWEAADAHVVTVTADRVLRAATIIANSYSHYGDIEPGEGFTNATD